MDKLATAAPAATWGMPIGTHVVAASSTGRIPAFLVEALVKAVDQVAGLVAWPVRQDAGPGACTWN
ncbi:hypothetical protein ACFQVC_28230 [Streptomyces monticola]|uniref:Uncharacterized protein n=1 Tax=Streptomyces monticola TaxID=2666263 RepID=A0ABW2JQU0_9ACTN